jgi:hypothetical protein
MPHPPQFWALVSVSTHAPEQGVKVPLHRMPQLVPLQSAVPLTGFGHAVVQVGPQPVAGPIGVQVPAQSTMPAGQPQTPGVMAPQVSVGPHAVLQAPQLALLCPVSTHPVPQWVRPELQASVHMVPLQTAAPVVVPVLGGGQAVVQDAPQLLPTAGISQEPGHVRVPAGHAQAPVVALQV